MKKNINIIQIKGFRGLMLAAFVITCLFAGFVVFPGLVAMKLWNYTMVHTLQIPTIGLFQGILLWGIIAGSYFTFKKDKYLVCMKTPEGLSDEELKAVFEDVKKQAQNDKILQAMLKAREAELKVKKSDETTNIDFVDLSGQLPSKQSENKEEVHHNP